jgi:hypothetical protein
MDTIEKQIYSLIDLSRKPNQDVKNICIQIQNCIDTGVHVHYRFLREALQFMCPLEIISLLYNNNKDAIHFSEGEITVFNLSDTRNITFEYNFEFFLSERFGEYFRFMLDKQIEYMEYVLKCLEIFQMKESDIDWDVSLKSGYLY